MFLAVCYDSRSNYVLIHFCSFCSFCCILTVFYCIVWFCCFGVINNNNTTTAQGTEPRETHNFSNQFLLLLIVFYPGSDSLFFTPPVIALYTPWLRKKRCRLIFFPDLCFPVPTKTLSYDSCVTITIYHYCLDTCGPYNN